MSGRVIYFQEQLSQESWENVFSPNDVNSKFLSTFVIKFETSISSI